MDCPDLETLSRALAEAPDGLRRRVLAHARSCAACDADLRALREVDEALVEPGTWGAGACLSEDQLLDALTRGVDPRHVLVCAECRADLLALRKSLVEAHQVATLPLRERLRRLASVGTTTVDMVTPYFQREGSARAHRGRSSRRRAQTSSRRRPRTAASQRRVRRPTGQEVLQSSWAWGGLTAAASLLVAIALTAAPGGRGDRSLASADDPAGRGGLRVSDVMATADGTGTGAARDPADPTQTGYEANRLPLVREPEPGPRPTPSPWDRDPAPQPRPERDTARPTASPDAETRTRSGVDSEPAAVARGGRPEEVVHDQGELPLDLSHFTGAVSVARGGGAWKPVGPGRLSAVLEPGDRLRSRSGGFLGLGDDGAEVALGRGTEVVVRRAAGGVSLGLVEGQLLCEVPTLAAAPGFEVVTRDGVFSVAGTVFAVEAGAERSRLTVSEGAVTVDNGLGVARIEAGFTAIVTGDAPPALGAAAGARDLDWAQGLIPRRQYLFLADFEQRRLAGFQGALAAGRGLGGGAALGLSPDATDARWSHAARVAKGRMSVIRAIQDTVVQVAVWSSRPAEVAIASQNETSAKTHLQRFSHPGGGWKTYSFPLLGMTTDYDPARDVVREGDLFVDLAVLVGGAAADEVLIDDVRVFRKVYTR